MKNIILAALLLICINSYSQGLNSVTTPDGVNIIAGGDNGLVMKSPNNGTSWYSTNLGSFHIKSVFSLGTNVWLGGSSGNIYKANANLTSVTPYNTGNNATINSVYFFDANTGLVCGNNGTIFKTTNGCQSWSASNNGIGVNVKLNSISFSNSLAGVVVGDSGRAYTTSDGGASWNALIIPVSTNLLKVKCYIDGTIITGEYGVILTKNTFLPTYTLVNTRTKSDIRSVAGPSFTNAHVVGGGGFIRNNKNGSSNFFNFELNPMMANLVDICFADSLNAYAVSSLNKAIIKTTDGGASWNFIPGVTAAYNWEQRVAPGSGIGNNLCQHPYDRNTIFCGYGNKVYVSRDRGENWTLISTVNIAGNSMHSFYVSPVDTNIWLAALVSSTDFIARSTDYGVTWTNVIARNFSTYGQPLEMDQNNPSTFYFAPDGTSTGIYKSTDNGATWFNLGPYGTSDITSPCDLIVMWDSSNVMYMGDDGGDVLKSTNSGVNWYLVKSPTSSETPSMCNSVFDKRICYATTWSSSQVWRTSNFGDTWNITANNGFSGWGSDLCREDPNLVITGSYGGSAALTTNGGTSWTAISNGLSGAGAGIIFIDRGYALNMQTSAIFKLRVTYSVITGINGGENSSGIPEKYSLSQNYPNPFNPVTSITYQIPEAGNVKLSVFDAAGREAAVLVNGSQFAGSYSVEFNGGGLASGTYFYRLSAGKFTETKKMILVK
jgi:photosystem II stability/assembly factor-like uncharacterized protein